MVTALVYGSPIAVSTDYAKSWRYLDPQSSHVDWCAVDWTDPDLRFILALKHESDGLLLVSQNGGKSFTEVGKGYGPGWVFDSQTAVIFRNQTKGAAKTGLWRTTDGGKTFQFCGAYSPVGHNSAQALPKWCEGKLYWLVEDGLITTTDKGMTWQRIGQLKNARYGPIFGRASRHLFVLTRTGVVESTDGGGTWSKPLAPPRAPNVLGGLSWLEYDPRHDVLYLMKMGSDLYRLARNGSHLGGKSEP
jgi:hypothetical protein